MWIKNKIENAFYELIAPEKQELINDSNLLDKKIDNSSPLQEAINNLKNKIKFSQTWKQREILEKQLKELEDLYNLYLQYKSVKITKKTQNKINQLFKDINKQISLKQNNINDDYEKIEKLINTEKERLKDTIDIFSYNTIRDMVEDNIDIIWTYESLPIQKYQDFFDIVTITYIDFLEEKLNRKLTKQDEEFLIKNKWFFLDKNETIDFIKRLIKNLNKKYINLEFFINLNKNWKQIKSKVILKKFLNLNINTKNKIKSNLKIKSNINKKEYFSEKTINNFKKYFWNLEIKSRKDINNMDFIKKLYWAIDRGEITIEDYKKILEYWYYLAFKKEIESPNWKKWLQNILKYEQKWRNIFKNNLKWIISSNKAKNLFLLSWIESNWLPKNKNRAWAIWYFQILLSTARKYDKNITVKQLQYNPIKSADISSRYLRDIIKNEVKYWKTDQEKIATALTIYNWNFIKRFKDKYRMNFQKTLYLLYKELSFIYHLNISWKEKIKKLKNTHRKFMNTNYKWKSHFWILEKHTSNKIIINKWIKNYLNIILRQQTMYPIQFNAFKKVYEEKKDN